jgi:hypothetical protein
MGVIGTYVEPVVWSCEMRVAQFAPVEYWLPCQIALGTCGSCATPV